MEDLEYNTINVSLEVNLPTINVSLEPLINTPTTPPVNIVLEETTIKQEEIKLSDCEVIVDKDLHYYIDEYGNPSWECDTKNNVDIELIVDRGDDGISAYELALRKGFVGTEDEWLQLLYFNRDVFLSESEYALLVQNDAVDLTKKYLIYEDDN